MVNLEVRNKSAFGGTQYEISSVMSQSQAPAVMDTRGHIAYDGKYRKPKWVNEKESEKVINFY